MTAGEEARPGQPAGIPISRALDLRPGIANDDLRAAVDAVNRVHGDGILPPLSMSVVGELVNGEGATVDGLFLAGKDPDGHLVPRSVLVRSAAPYRRFVTLHEIGHVLDVGALPGAGFASADWDGLQLWRQAVARSRAFKTLEGLAAINPERIGNLLLAEELWARTYAQFVAIRGGDPALLAALDSPRRRDPSALYYPRQWENDDFHGIERAIDDLFRGLGWIA